MTSCACPLCPGRGVAGFHDGAPLHFTSARRTQPVFKTTFPAPMRFTERDVDLMGEAELRILVKKLLAERERL